jgi:hypothetical protein
VIVFAENVRAGDRLSSGDRIESIETIPVGPDWIVAVWIEDAEDFGVGQPTLTWKLDTEVEIIR